MNDGRRDEQREIVRWDGVEAAGGWRAFATDPEAHRDAFERAAAERIAQLTDMLQRRRQAHERGLRMPDVERRRWFEDGDTGLEWAEAAERARQHGPDDSPLRPHDPDRFELHHDPRTAAALMSAIDAAGGWARLQTDSRAFGFRDDVKRFEDTFDRVMLAGGDPARALAGGFDNVVQLTGRDTLTIDWTGGGAA